MKTIKVYEFTIKNKTDGKRHLMRLSGTPASKEDFRENFNEVEDYDLRTIRWLEEFEVVDNFSGCHVSHVFDSQDNYFVESENSQP